MLAPVPHPRESARLKAVRELRLYGSEPPKALDNLTLALSAALKVPVAMITVIEEADIWFLSCVGLPARQGPRELSICGHTILGSEELVVTDTRLDGRFADNPSFSGDPPVVAYAGTAINDIEGLPIGTICVVDHEPRHFTAAQIELLRCFAALVQREIFAQQSIALARLQLDEERAALHRSEQRFTTVFQSSPVGKATFDLEGRWIQVNPALCEIVGHTPAALIGTSFRDLSFAADRDREEDMIRRCLAGEISRFQIETRFLHRHGEAIWVNLTAALIRPGTERPYFIAVVEDISARKQAESDLEAMRQGLECTVAERTSDLRHSNERLQLSMADAQKAERLVRARETELRTLIEQAPDAYVSIDEAGVIRDWNSQAEKTFGWTAAEALGRPLENTLVPPQLRRGLLRRARRAMWDRPLRDRAELLAMHRDGRHIPVEIRLQRVEIEGSMRLTAFLHDISERKAVESERASAQRKLQLIADNVPALVSYLDPGLRYVWANQAYEDYFALDPAQMIGLDVGFFLEPDSRRQVHALLQRALAGASVAAEIEQSCKGRPCHWQVKYVPDIEQGRVIGIHGMTLDITERKCREIELSRDANLDVLTGLLNRRGLFAFLGEQVARDPQAGASMAVLLLDLNRFKQINDTLGHLAGDAVLKEIGRRLSSLPGANCARLGGDEFVVVLSPGATTDLDTGLRRVVDAFEAPVSFDGRRIEVTASIGECWIKPGEGLDPDTILRLADESMYRQKKRHSPLLRGTRDKGRTGAKPADAELRHALRVERSAMPGLHKSLSG